MVNTSTAYSADNHVLFLVKSAVLKNGRVGSMPSYRPADRLCLILHFPFRAV